MQILQILTHMSLKQQQYTGTQATSTSILLVFEALFVACVCVEYAFPLFANLGGTLNVFLTPFTLSFVPTPHQALVAAVSTNFVPALGGLTL